MNNNIIHLPNEKIKRCRANSYKFYSVYICIHIETENIGVFFLTFRLRYGIIFLKKLESELPYQFIGETEK